MRVVPVPTIAEDLSRMGTEPPYRMDLSIPQYLLAREVVLRGLCGSR